MKYYCASGWFSYEQEESRKIILNTLKKAKFDVYSPKDDGLFKEGMNPEEIFQENLKQIRECDFVIASTEGKDLGTLFESGYAFARSIPIIYFWNNGFGNFNLMLSQSAHRVTTTSHQLFALLCEIKQTGVIQKVPYTGDIE